MVTQAAGFDYVPANDSAGYSGDTRVKESFRSREGDVGDYNLTMEQGDDRGACREGLEAFIQAIRY